MKLGLGIGLLAEIAYAYQLD